MKFFVRDFCETVQARVVIFGVQVDNGVLCRGIAIQPSPAYFSLHLSNFLSFHTLNDEIFVNDFCETVQARVFIFGMQIDNDVLYRGIARQPSPACSSLYLSDFLSFHTLNDEIFVKDFSETVQARIFIFGMQLDNDVLYRGIANQPTPAYSFLYLSIFLSLYIFRQTWISPQLYRIETSKVYRFTTTCCIVKLKMGLLLFVLPYMFYFFFLSRFFVEDIFTTV